MQIPNEAVDAGLGGDLVLPIAAERILFTIRNGRVLRTISAHDLPGGIENLDLYPFFFLLVILLNLGVRCLRPGLFGLCGVGAGGIETARFIFRLIFFGLIFFVLIFLLFLLVRFLDFRFEGVVDHCASRRILTSAVAAEKRF